MTRAELAEMERGLDVVMAAGLPSPFVRRFPPVRHASRRVHACAGRERSDGGPYFEHGPRETCNYCNPTQEG